MKIIDKAIGAYLGIKKSLSLNDPALVALLRGMQTNTVQKPYENVPSVYSPVKAIIDNIAQVKLKIENPDGEKILFKNYPDIFNLFNTVQDTDGGKLTFSEFMQWASGFYSLRGELFLIKVMTTAGQEAGTKLPDYLILCNPYNVEAITAGDDGKTVVGWKIRNKPYTLNEVIHIKDFNPYDNIRGLSPLSPISDELNIDNEANATTVAMFQNDGTPGVILETDKLLAPNQLDTLRTGWEARHGGSNNKGKMAVLTGGMKANKVAFSNTEMQFTDLLKSIEQKIIGTWRVPKAMFGYTDDINYATFLGQLKVFWTMTQIPLLNKFADFFNKELIFPAYGSKVVLGFDLSNVEALQDNINDFADSIVKLTNVGFTRNELNKRFKLGFEDNTQWGDKYFIPFSMVEAGTGSIADVANQPVKEVKKKDSSIETEVINGLTYTKAQVKFLKNLNNIHDTLHKRFQSAIRKYFKGQRKRFLDLIDEANPKGITKGIKVNINWKREAELFEEMAQPYEQEGIERGVNEGVNVTGEKPSDRIKYNMQAATVGRLNFVSDQVTTTQRKEVEKLVSDTVESGATVIELKDNLKKYFNKLDNRALTIARTEMTAQLNGGLLLQYDDIGVDKKQWLTNIDGFERESHLMINGEIRNINEPFSNGLQMPGDLGDPSETINCLIPDTKVHGVFDLATRALYNGKTIIIKTVNGNSLTCTPNHPILTSQGWIFAKDINETHDILSYSNIVNEVSVLGDIDNNNIVPKISDVFDTLASYGASSMKMSSALDFDGDFGDSKPNIDIVGINRKLLDGVNPDSNKLGEDFRFMLSDSKGVSVETDGSFSYNIDTIMASTPSTPSFRHLPFNKVRTSFDGLPFYYFGFGSGSKIDIGFTKNSVDDRPADTELFRELLDTYPNNISIDKVASVNSGYFSGHVYDLQSKDGFIIAENIVISNCRCSVLPYREGV